MKQTLVTVLLVMCGIVPLSAAGKKAPEISALVHEPPALSWNGAGQIQEAARITIDWTAVTKPFINKYALYRGSRPSGSGLAVETYHFVEFLPLPVSGSAAHDVIDTAVEGGNEYFYHIFYAPQAVLDTGTPEAALTINIKSIPKHIQPKRIAVHAVVIPQREGSLADTSLEPPVLAVQTAPPAEELPENGENPYLSDRLNDRLLVEEDAEDAERPSASDDLPPAAPAPAAPEPPSRSAAPDPRPSVPKTAPPGLYTGIISFSGDVIDITKKSSGGVEIGAALALDTFQAKDLLIKQFENSYHLSGSYGTSLYYAIHKAVVNIANGMDDETILPKDIHAVHLVIITDGYDNNSSDTALKPLTAADWQYRITEDQRGSGYAEFLQNAVFQSAQIKGVPLTTWLFGIQDEKKPDDLPDAEFNKLKTILEADNAGGIAGDIDTIQSELEKIIQNLDSLNDQTHIFAAVPSLTNNSWINIQIDEAASIRAQVIIQGGRTYLTNITSEPAALLARTPARIEYIEHESAKGYEFILNGDYYSKYAGTSQTGLISADGGTAPFSGESFVNFNPYNFSVDRKTAVVYFVIDNSRSLGEEKIAKIRRSVRHTIESLFRQNISGDGSGAIAATAGGTGGSAAGTARTAAAGGTAASGATRTATTTGSGGTAASGATPPTPAPRPPTPDPDTDTNPPLPDAKKEWPPAFVSFVKSFGSGQYPWRVKTANVSPLQSNSSSSMVGWYIQFGAYSQKANAEKVKGLLEQAGFKGVWVYSTEASGGTTELHKVHTGPYDDGHIQQALNEIRTLWLNLGKR